MTGGNNVLEMGAYRVVIGLVMVGAVAGAARAFEPSFHPSLHVAPAPGAIHIDGELDDPGWVGVAVADGFAENSPGDQIEPPVHSEAWVTYDESNIYIALIAADDPATVRKTLSDRDNIWRDDYFGIMLDTYGDSSWGYEFFVNPLGIQGDLRMSSEGGEDMGFDLVWFSEGRITETGYQVEIAIPFASLRFEGRPEQMWRVNFWRDHQREVRRRYSWAALDRDDPCFLCQFGYLEGIRGITPGSNVDVIGSVVGFQSGALAPPSEGTPGLGDFENEDPDGEVGINVRYALSSSSSAELTLNPDFSQIESDAGQIDVNSTFALFFPESRPFFQEGSNLYDTWINAIYPRSINNPTVAGKLTGQFGDAELLYLFARDDNSPLIVPFEEFSAFAALDNSVSNIARAQYNLPGDGYIGTLLTDRRHDGGASGTTFGVDTRVRFAKSLSLEAQVLASHTQEPDSTDFGGVSIDLPESPYETYDTFEDGKHTAAFDGESFWGQGYYVSLERGGRTYNADFDYWEYSPGFRTDNGFTTRNDYRQASFWNGLSWQPSRKVLQSWDVGLGVGRVWNTEGRFKDEWLEPSVSATLIGQTNLNIDHLWSAERFSGKTIEGIRRTNFNASSRFTDWFGVGLFVRTGRLIWRDFSDPQLGDAFDMSAELNLRPTERLRVDSSWDYSTLASRRHGMDFFRAHVFRSRWTYGFSRRFYLRLVAEYRETETYEYDEATDGSAMRTDTRKRRGLALEPLLTYEINPFTVFYVGATSDRREFEPDDENSLVEPVWRESARQIFAKVSYLWQL